MYMPPYSPMYYPMGMQGADRHEMTLEEAIAGEEWMKGLRKKIEDDLQKKHDKKGSFGIIQMTMVLFGLGPYVGLAFYLLGRTLFH